MMNAKAWNKILDDGSEIAFLKWLDKERADHFVRVEKRGGVEEHGKYHIKSRDEWYTPRRMPAFGGWRLAKKEDAAAPTTETGDSPPETQE